jgi:hypothetical protein
LATAPRGAGRPGRGCGRPGMPSSSSPSPWQRPCRAVSPATTSPSTPGQHGDLPSRAQRDHHPTGRAVFDWRCGPCPLRERCTRAKDGKTLTLGPHDGELVAARRQAADPPSRPATGAGGPCGTLDRLAGRQRPPPGPLPRSGPQPARSVSPGGRDQSTPAGHHGTGPPPWRVGPGLNQALSGPGVSMRDDSTARASSVAGLHPQAPALRIGQLPGPPSSLRHQSPAPKAGYSAAS